MLPLYRTHTSTRLFMNRKSVYLLAFVYAYLPQLRSWQRYVKCLDRGGVVFIDLNLESKMELVFNASYFVLVPIGKNRIPSLHVIYVTHCHRLQTIVVF